jgi:hypothetical protein
MADVRTRRRRGDGDEGRLTEHITTDRRLSATALLRFDVRVRPGRSVLAVRAGR